MRTLKNTEALTIKLKSKDVINGEYIPFTYLSKLVCEIEKEKNLSYKTLRTRLYNSFYNGKYNTEEIAGISCVNVRNPMKEKASLELTFKLGE